MGYTRIKVNHLKAIPQILSSNRNWFIDMAHYYPFQGSIVRLVGAYAMAVTAILYKGYKRKESTSTETLIPLNVLEVNRWRSESVTYIDTHSEDNRTQGWRGTSCYFKKKIEVITQEIPQLLSPLQTSTPTYINLSLFSSSPPPLLWS